MCIRRQVCHNFTGRGEEGKEWAGALIEPPKTPQKKMNTKHKEQLPLFRPLSFEGGVDVWVGVEIPCGVWHAGGS